MTRLAICIALTFALFFTPALSAEAQETPATPAAAPAEEAAAAAPDAAETPECTPARPPGLLQITMPAEPVEPACVAKRNCTKAAADAFNKQVLAYNNFMMKVNDATATYVDKLNAYSRDAGRYTSCEIQRLNKLTVQ